MANETDKKNLEQFAKELVISNVPLNYMLGYVSQDHSKFLLYGPKFSWPEYVYIRWSGQYRGMGIEYANGIDLTIKGAPWKLLIAEAERHLKTNRDLYIEELPYRDFLKELNFRRNLAGRRPK